MHLAPFNVLYKNNTPKLLVLSLDVTKDLIKHGSKETVTTAVSDTTSKEKIAGAKVVGKVTSISGGAVKEAFEGATDNNGQMSYTWKIEENFKATKYKVTVQASATGYQDVTSSTVFKVKPSTTSKNDHDSNDAGSGSHKNKNRHNNNNKNNNDNNFEVSTDSNYHGEDQNTNNNDFGESITANINDFTHEIVNRVNDMIKIHIR